MDCCFLGKRGKGGMVYDFNVLSVLFFIEKEWQLASV
jgi:hypothetical protein